MKGNDYRTWVFDCDGVLLDSNSLKTEAFRKLALPFGKRQADQLVEYHRSRGGMSRHQKVAYFVEKILGKDDPALFSSLLAEFGTLVKKELFDCALLPGALALLESLPASTKRYVVSGALETELVAVLEH